MGKDPCRCSWSWALSGACEWSILQGLQHGRTTDLCCFTPTCNRPSPDLKVPLQKRLWIYLILGFSGWKLIMTVHFTWMLWKKKGKKYQSLTEYRLAAWPGHWVKSSENPCYLVNIYTNISMKKIIYIHSYKPNSHAQMCSKHRAVSKQSSVTGLISCVFQMCRNTRGTRSRHYPHPQQSVPKVINTVGWTRSTANPASPLLSDVFYELVALFRQNSASSSE